jgi:hypothetical protein
VLRAAAALFALHGVDAVSLRDIAAAAFRRSRGTSAAGTSWCLRCPAMSLTQLARAVEAHPLSGQGFSPDTVMRKWFRIAAALVISGRSLESRPDVNPAMAMAETLMAGYGLAAEAARLPAAQIVAAALGWQIFEDYLVPTGGLEAIRWRRCGTNSCIPRAGWAPPPGPRRLILSPEERPYP